VTDVSSVLNIFKNNHEVDEVYNLAAQSHVATSFKQPAHTWDVTGKGCLNLLQALVDTELDAKFYQASSSEMFGSSFDRDRNGVKYQNENTKLMPNSPYAIAKTAAHHAVRIYRDAYELHASSGILFNHEGPRRGDNFVTQKIINWISEFVKQYKSKDFPKLRLGNLDASRDWGFAGDYVEAMWLMLQQDKPDDYVICTGETHTIRDFLDIAFKQIDIDNWEDWVVIDPEFYRPSEVPYLKGDCSKAIKKLGWRPKYNLEGLIRLMLDAKL
jgi:GDPmannose 4,6-dehydratase